MRFAMVALLVVVGCPHDSDLDTDLSGTYAVRTVVTTIDETPGGEQNTTGYSYGIAVITADPDQVTETFCRMTMVNDGPLAMEITDETVRAIPSVTVPVDISEADGEVSLYRPVHPLPLGAILDDPINDPLPTSAEDPRVVDHEGDSHPGMTVHLSGPVTGAVYAVRRERFDYTVTLREDGSLHGHTVDTGEQHIIGASDPLFEIETTTRQNPDLTLSPVALIPLSDHPTCEELVERIDTLFPD